MPKIMITGVNGFVGQHLARQMKHQDCEVIGVSQGGKDPGLDGLVDQYFACDLTSQEEVNALSFDQLDAVISLAGLASVGASFADPDKYLRINTAVLDTLATRLIRDGQTNTRLLAISSGAVYEPTSPPPFSEDTPLVKNGSPYAASKIAMENRCADYREKGLDCIVIRPFNHTGPGQLAGFLIPDLAHKLIDSARSGQPVAVGNLDTARDYTDVRDIVRAYGQLALAPTGSLNHGVYNVCSGKSITGQTILELLKAALPETQDAEIKVDDSLLRPDDPLVIFGSNERIHSDTGWLPTTPIEQTISDYAKWLKESISR